jgi:hypothetical protein
MSIEYYIPPNLRRPLRRAYNLGYQILDNVIGFDDEYETSGERLGTALRTDPVNTASEFGKSAYQGARQGLMDFASSPTQFASDLLDSTISNIGDAGSRLSVSELTPYLPEGVSESTATNQQLRDAYGTMLGDVTTIGSLVPATRGAAALGGLATDAGIEINKRFGADIAGLGRAVAAGDLEQIGEIFGPAGQTSDLSAAVVQSSLGADMLSMAARAKPALAQVLSEKGINPDNIDASPIGTINDAISVAVQRGLLDARTAQGYRQRFAEAEELKPKTGFTSSGIPLLYGGAEPLPGSEEKLLEALEKVPELENILRFLTPDEASAVTPGTAQKLEAAFRSVDPDDLIGAAVAGNPKLGWYRESSRALGTIFEDDTKRFAALLAALSPQTSVEMNLRNAVETWANWTKAGRPKDPDQILEIMGRSVLGDKGEKSVLDAWKKNSIKTLSKPEGTPDSEFRLSGPKVDSFALNSTGDLVPVTNDAWMANTSGVPQELYARSSSSNPDPGFSPGYLGTTAQTRVAADKMTNILGTRIMPAEVQETVWSFGKALYEDMKAGKADGGPSALQIYREGLLTPERIADTPDFGTLLSQFNYGEPLREVGYGSLIDEAARSAQGFGTRDISFAANRAGAENVARRLDTLYQHRQFVSAASPFRYGSNDLGRANAGKSEFLASYGKRSGGLVPLSFGGVGGIIKPTPAFTDFITRQGLTPTDFVKLGNDTESRRAFVAKMTEAQESRGAIGKSVTINSANKYKGYKLFTTPDGEGGFAISPDGELSSLVSKFDSGLGRGFTDNVLAAGVSEGGKWLNAFDTVLPQKYSRFGFQPVARLKFNEEIMRADYGDEAVDAFMSKMSMYNNGQPDLVFMVFNPKFTASVARNVGGELVDTYDDAMKLVNRKINELENPKPKKK